MADAAGELDAALATPEPRPGFWRSIAGVVAAVAVGNFLLALVLQAASWLGPPLLAPVQLAVAVALALGVPYLVCRISGAADRAKRRILRAFAVGALPFALGLGATKAVNRMRDLAFTELSPWQSLLWHHDRLVERALFAMAFIAASVVFWRGRRPSSRYRAVAVTAIAVFMSWFAVEWLDVHRAWQSASAAGTVWGALDRMMLAASAHVFLTLSLGLGAGLLLREWPGYAAEEPAKESFVRNIALGVALFAFASAAVLRPMVQKPRRMLNLLKELGFTGRLDGPQQAELLQFGAPAIAELRDMTQDSSVDPVARVAAVSILAKLEDEAATEFLLRLLHDGCPEVRTRAFRILRERAPGPAAERLTEMLEDEWAEYRLFAATGLGTLQRKPPPRELVILLQDKSKPVRCYAVWALGKIGDKSCVPELITALTDEEKKVRAMAATALFRIGDTRAVPALRQALKDEAELVRYLAAEALGHLGDREALPVLVEAVEVGCGLRPRGKVNVKTAKMVEAMAHIPAEAVLPALHNLYRRAPRKAKVHIGHAIDFVREKELERQLGGAPPPE